MKIFSLEVLSVLLFGTLNFSLAKEEHQARALVPFSYPSATPETYPTLLQPPRDYPPRVYPPSINQPSIKPPAVDPPPYKQILLPNRIKNALNVRIIAIYKKVYSRPRDQYPILGPAPKFGPSETPSVTAVPQSVVWDVYSLTGYTTRTIPILPRPTPSTFATITHKQKSTSTASTV